MLLYVDDSVFIENDDLMIKEFTSFKNERFEMVDLGKGNIFLKLNFYKLCACWILKNAILIQLQGQIWCLLEAYWGSYIALFISYKESSSLFRRNIWWYIPQEGWKGDSIEFSSSDLIVILQET